jgi:hypothetical protein
MGVTTTTMTAIATMASMSFLLDLDLPLDSVAMPSQTRSEDDRVLEFVTIPEMQRVDEAARKDDVNSLSFIGVLLLLG